MKLISHFKNKYNNITYYTYETSNGISVLYLDNPATVDFDFGVIFKAGTCFETIENVPHGTAHFLEHMLLNPNSKFKSKEQIDRFEQGDKEKPSLFINASTTRKNIYITGHSNIKGSLRILERLESTLIFSKKKFATQMEKERGIVLAEKSRKPKREKDSSLMMLEFLFKDINQDFAYDILGEGEDIKKITIDDLEKFFKNRFVTTNCVMAIQSNGVLKKNIERRIEDISKKVLDTKYNERSEDELKNKYRVGVFEDDRATGITVSFLNFDLVDKKTDYKKYAIEHIYGRLLDWLAFDILREKLSLVYDFSTFKTGILSYKYDLYGFRFTTEKEKFEVLLKELYDLLYTKAFIFLKSKKGREWFDDVISTYIFPRTTKYDDELAENGVVSTLEGIEIFNANIAVREGKKITIDDITKYLKERLEIPPHIWIESDMQKKEIEGIVKSSSFAKKFMKK